jgi:hypothetical protein
MRIQIDLGETILEQLEWMANRDARKRKNLIERIITKAAEDYSPKNPKWLASKKKKPI